MTPTFWDNHSVGLVLTGGGAKGAYEIGCWKALRNAGISRFKAVSGTSIGGINAFLVCRGDLEDAERIWNEMGEKTPLPTSLFRISGAFLERYGLASVFAVYALIFSPLAMLGVVITVGLLLALGDVLHPIRALALPAGILSAVAIARYFPASRGARLTGTAFSIRTMKRFLRHEMPVEFSIFCGAVALAIPPGLLIYETSMRASWWWLLLWPLCAALAIATIMLLAELGISSFGELSFLSSDVLEALLQENIEGLERLPSEPKLYVTRLRTETVDVPGRVPPKIHAALEAIVRSTVPQKSLEDVTAAEIDLIRRKMTQSGLDRYFSDSTEDVIGLEYVPLAGKPMVEVAECLISTSAIAGVLARGRERLPSDLESDAILRAIRAEFYDAGSMDNTPVAPLLEREDCDVLIVVFLDYGIRPEKARSRIAASLGSINERIRRHNNDLDDATWEQLKHSRTLTPIRDAPSRLTQVQLIPIVPSEDLGSGFAGFLRETVRFRKQRVQQLMELGFRDATHALQVFFAERGEAVRPK